MTCVHHNLEKLSPVFAEARPELLLSLQLFLGPPGFCHAWHPATRNRGGWDRKMGTVIGHTNTAVMEAACIAFGNFCFRYRLRITEQITEHDHKLHCVHIQHSTLASASESSQSSFSILPFSLSIPTSNQMAKNTI